MPGILTDPALVNALDGNGVEVIPTFPTATLDDHQACSFENAEVLHDRGAIKFWQDAGKRSRCLWTLFQRVENATSGFVCEGLEDQVVVTLS